MSLTLYLHPLASYCWKVLIALYENDTPFTPHLVDLGDEAERAALARCGVGKFPVLHDEARDQTVPESSIIMDYLERHYPGRAFFPAISDRTGRRGSATASTISMSRADAEDRGRPAAPRGQRMRMASPRRGRCCWNPMG